MALAFSISCSDQKENEPNVEDKVFTIDRTAITKDFSSWYRYTYYDLVLSDDFIGLDKDSTAISKSEFLTQLSTGNFIAFKTRIKDGKSVLKLENNSSKDESVRSTIIQMATSSLKDYKMEGTELPTYNFSDLNNKIYSNASTKGKIILLKCWFIQCVACVEEFPILNKLVEDNNKRNDILYISLAMDEKSELEAFLKKKPFSYTVVPSARDFMMDDLLISSFPTHILVGKDGKIIKVASRIEEIVAFIPEN